MVLAAVTFSLVLAIPQGASPASANHPGWASASSATIQPGVQTRSPSGQCTANFVFKDSSGGIYLGQAAHCASTGGALGTNGCDTPSLAIGTPVEFVGSGAKGWLAYSSWLTMQDVDESNSATCAYNDFALVKVKSTDHGKVNPSVPFWGGPKGLSPKQAPEGDPVYSYGNSSLRLGVQELSPKTGINLLNDRSGWTSDVYTVTPSIPGDSGSGFMDGEGKAIGLVVTVQLAPYAGSNGVTNLDKALDYAAEHAGLKVTLVNGSAFRTIL